MNYVVTNAEMREADKYTIEKAGVSSLTLMERAGEALYREASKMAPQGRILCLCGGGNNGGDGLVCARYLRQAGREVDLLLIAEKRSAESGANLQKWIELGGETLGELPEKKYALAVDCLFGTGFHGKLKGEEERAVKGLLALRKGGTKILSADIPSGVNGGDGSVEGLAVRADVTLCIGEIKSGVLFGDGIDYAGEVKRVDIGIQLPKGEYAKLVDDEWVAACLPKRSRNSHKGNYGKAAIVAGSMEYSGAAYLSAAACLRSGAGYTTLFLPKDLLSPFILRAPEILLKPINDGGKYAFNEKALQGLLSYDSIAYGMGMGTSAEVYYGASWLLQRYEGVLILDADGLNSLAKYGKERLGELFARKKCSVLLTPHVKEFSRLCGSRADKITKEGLSLAKTFAKTHGVTVLLKNAVSVATDGENAFVNDRGTSGQAKGGSGDVLSGVIAGLCAGGMSALNASAAGAYLVGRAAELATEDIGAYSLVATDIIAYLGRAFQSVTRSS